ncbi:MAG: formylglycine-generating enzyme family protein [Spirochaetaceae bacterium]|nr:formylglycine-generating enzyme family protein [Spirochaetaceae bacterium]
MEKVLVSICLFLIVAGSLVSCSKAEPHQEGQAGGEHPLAQVSLQPGEEYSAALFLGDSQLAKTSEVVVAATVVAVEGTGADDSKVFLPGRTITLAPFAIGRYEVTQELYVAVMGKNPSGHQGDKRSPADGEVQHLRPVEEVTWYDSIVFCNQLTAATMGEASCVYYSDKALRKVYSAEDGKLARLPYMDMVKKGYRLPLEVEWEYAARGGNTDDAESWMLEYAGSDVIEEVTWYNATSPRRSHEVGMKAPNSLGLYDMSGNVWEWCWDWFGTVKSDTPVTGLAEPSSSGEFRVYRGGSFGRSAPYCTVSTRSGIVPEYDGRILGLRVARSL